MSVLVAPEITVQFTEDSYTVAEGGTQAVTVELNGDPRRTFTIPITTTDEGGGDLRRLFGHTVQRDVQRRGNLQDLQLPRPTPGHGG